MREHAWRVRHLVMALDRLHRSVGADGLHGSGPATQEQIAVISETLSEVIVVLTDYLNEQFQNTGTRPTDQF